MTAWQPPRLPMQDDPLQTVLWIGALAQAPGEPMRFGREFGKVLEGLMRQWPAKARA